MDPQQPEPVSYLCGGLSFSPLPLASPLWVWPICRTDFLFEDGMGWDGLFFFCFCFCFGVMVSLSIGWIGLDYG
jgi:hypothetical protein